MPIPVKLPSVVKLVAENPEQTYVFFDSEPAQVANVKVVVTLTMPDGVQLVMTSVNFEGEFTIHTQWER